MATIKAMTPPRSPSSPRSPSPTPSPMPLLSDEDCEREEYQLLVELGGRPLYNIELLRDIQREPEKYRELLAPWQEGPGDQAGVQWSGIFASQSYRWRRFLAWRTENCAQDMEAPEADSQDHAGGHPLYGQLRERLAQPGFLGYVSALKQRLTRHGVSWESYDLRENWEDQDAMASWVEYLNFELWSQEKARKAVRAARRWQGPFSSCDRRRVLQDLSRCNRIIQWALDQVPVVAKEVGITNMPRDENDLPSQPGPKTLSTRKRKQVRFNDDVTIIGPATSEVSPVPLVKKRRREIQDDESERPRKRCRVT